MKRLFYPQREQEGKKKSSSFKELFCFISVLLTSECSSARATSSCRRFCAVCRLCFWTRASATTKKHHWCMLRGGRWGMTSLELEERERERKKSSNQETAAEKIIFQITKSLQGMCWRGAGGDGVDSFWLEKRENRGCKYSTLSYFGKLVLVRFDHETEIHFLVSYLPSHHIAFSNAPFIFPLVCSQKI